MIRINAVIHREVPEHNLTRCWQFTVRLDNGLKHTRWGKGIRITLFWPQRPQAPKDVSSQTSHLMEPEVSDSHTHTLSTPSFLWHTECLTFYESVHLLWIQHELVYILTNTVKESGTKTTTVRHNHRAQDENFDMSNTEEKHWRRVFLAQRSSEFMSM